MNKRILWILPVVMLFTMACGITFNLGDNGFRSDAVRGSGNLKTETRSVSGFDQVTLTGSGDLTIQVGDKESLTIEAEDNILPLITSNVVGHRLELGFKPNTSVNATRPIHFNLTVKSLNSVSLTGSGTVTAPNLKADSMEIHLLGSGDMRFDNLNTQKLTVQLTGSGNVVTSGQAQSVDVRIPGSGKFDGSDLQSQTASATIGGSGHILVWAKDSLDVHISGSGTVEYYGTPRLTQKVNGSGSVVSQGEH